MTLAQLMLQYVQEVKNYYDRNHIVNGKITVQLVPEVPFCQTLTLGPIHDIGIEVAVPPRIIL